MSTINTLQNNNLYYQLNGGNAQSTTQPSGTSILLDALGAGSSNTSTSALDTVSLSDAAKQYLSNLQSTSSASSIANQTGFTLTSDQQQKITDILTKYKDAPFTQDTFNQIQNDLTAAGLGTTQLSLQDKAKNFNPTAILIADLNGDFSQAAQLASPSSSEQQAKANNYMQQIISQWKNLSGNTSSDAVSAAGATSGS